MANMLEIASDRITTCTIDGDALMIRKDSRLAEWFNPALQTVLGSREYRQICKDIDDYYNSKNPFLSNLLFILSCPVYSRYTKFKTRFLFSEQVENKQRISGLSGQIYRFSRCVVYLVEFRMQLYVPGV